MVPSVRKPTRPGVQSVETSFEIDGKTPLDPRGDLSGVDPVAVEEHVFQILQLLGADKDDVGIADDLREYTRNYLVPRPEEWILVSDVLRDRKILTKAQFRAFLALVFEAKLENV